MPISKKSAIHTINSTDIKPNPLQDFYKIMHDTQMSIQFNLSYINPTWAVNKNIIIFP